MIDRVMATLGLHSYLELFLAIALLAYAPLALYQSYLIVDSLIHNDEDLFGRQGPRKTNNNVIVSITTNGKATDVVCKIIRKLRKYRSVSGIFVVKEENDAFEYDCNQIVVPKSYRCKNGSRNKMRALQFATEEFHRMGFGEETYIVHLDDDSIVDRPYLDYVKYYLTDAGAQGCVRLRAWGVHLFSSLADIIRISNCEAWCRHYNTKGAPQFVHGEGLTIRADAEYEIGWDYGTYGAEDLMMGLYLSKRYSFTHIPTGHIFIAPPTTMRDFYRQRRRWFWSVLKNDGRVRRLDFRTWAFYMYLYANGTLGIFSLVLFPAVLIIRGDFSGCVELLSIIDILCFFAYYQFGAAYMRSPAISAMLFLFQVPVAFYEGLTTVYSLISRPDFSTFETIKKV